MLRILGSPKRLCDGLTRRAMLRAGALGFGGLTLENYLRASATQPRPPAGANFGRAKACILLFPYGSPPQHETFDPKPDAPVEIQGEMRAISTSVPGVWIGDTSAFPTASGTNPMITAMALAHRTAEHLAAAQGAGTPAAQSALQEV